MRGIIPALQAAVLVSCVGSVTYLGGVGVIDAAAVTAILGTIAGSVGVLAAQHAATIANGDKQEEDSST